MRAQLWDRRDDARASGYHFIANIYLSHNSSIHYVAVTKKGIIRELRVSGDRAGVQQLKAAMYSESVILLKFDTAALKELDMWFEITEEQEDISAEWITQRFLNPGNVADEIMALLVNDGWNVLVGHDGDYLAVVG